MKKCKHHFELDGGQCIKCGKTQIDIWEEIDQKIINKKMKEIPTREENPNGLHQRYIVSKTDGELVDDNAEYFILRLDEGGNDLKHIKACRKAVRTYAKKIKKHLPILSQDLLERYPKIKKLK